MNISRKGIYDYVANLLSGITSNIYRGGIPVTLKPDATTNGFIVLRLSGIRDFSEFSLNTYGQVRMSIEYYTPSTNTKNALEIMNTIKFEAAQQAIDKVIDEESQKTNGEYTITREGILSTDGFFTNNTNSFYIYITSFLITL